VEYQIFLPKLAGSQHLVGREVKVGCHGATCRTLFALVAQEYVLVGTFLDLVGEIGPERNSHGQLLVARSNPQLP
jgi:hypothetical protein